MGLTRSLDFFRDSAAGLGATVERRRAPQKKTVVRALPAVRSGSSMRRQMIESASLQDLP